MGKRRNAADLCPQSGDLSANVFLGAMETFHLSPVEVEPQGGNLGANPQTLVFAILSTLKGEHWRWMHPEPGGRGWRERGWVVDQEGEALVHTGNGDPEPLLARLVRALDSNVRVWRVDARDPRAPTAANDATAAWEREHVVLFAPLSRDASHDGWHWLYERERDERKRMQAMW